eukprot:scaffold7453_cov128-Isochrysis_galbana.AAC.1
MGIENTWRVARNDCERGGIAKATARRMHARRRQGVGHRRCRRASRHITDGTAGRCNPAACRRAHRARELAPGATRALLVSFSRAPCSHKATHFAIPLPLFPSKAYRRPLTLRRPASHVLRRPEVPEGILWRQAPTTNKKDADQVAQKRRQPFLPL